MHVLQITKTGINVRQRERLTSGAQGIFKVSFDFSAEWDDLAPKAVFTNGSVTIETVISNGTVTIPHEVLAQAGRTVQIEITGFDEEGLIVLPTIRAALGAGAVEPGRLDGENPGEPTPELIAQALAAAKAAETSANSAAVSADEAEEAAEENARLTTQMSEYVFQTEGLADKIAANAKTVEENTSKTADNTASALAAKESAEAAQANAEAAADEASADAKQTAEDRTASEEARTAAETAATAAEISAERSEQAAAQAGWIEIVPEDGYLILYKTDNVGVTFVDNNGILEVEYT